MYCTYSVEHHSQQCSMHASFYNKTSNSSIQVRKSTYNKKVMLAAGWADPNRLAQRHQRKVSPIRKDLLLVFGILQLIKLINKV